jgi:hypothetical protein
MPFAFHAPLQSSAAEVKAIHNAAKVTCPLNSPMRASCQDIVTLFYLLVFVIFWRYVTNLPLTVVSVLLLLCHS